ncbi:hypothetical protein MAPG_09379 [Magnaporthiopsis poae ATCC 64411]|uniref:Amine oxidase n=1 Tax=Magnaporthiopsis poae (strain ATCC 64411 / 73-15) TaxID=644358 RepID=A0A0C4E9T1_MAGP6|nr:hypothetical protein MAPG_09379 [Magnaporthiopsis poae ATCC 64411]
MRTTAIKMWSGAGLIASTLLAARAAARPSAATIECDVAIIGGGAAGSHAAVWLRDHGLSVVVIEKARQLGGHTAFYEDPATGKTINVGVQAWMEYKDAFTFPERMGVSVNGSMEFATLEYKYVDMKTGKEVPGWTPPAATAMSPALQKYVDTIAKYENIMMPGFENFPKAGEIPEDLLMPFGQFVAKYGIEASVPNMWDATVQGLGDPMHVPTLFVIQASGLPMARALLGTARSAVPASGRLYDLYDAVAAFLGDDVLYSSTVVSSKRTETGVTLEVQRSKCKSATTVKAKRLLVTMEPTPESMAPLDLDQAETDVFSKIGFSTVYAGILRHPALKAGKAYSNRSPLPGSTNYTVFPVAAQLGRMDWIKDTKDLFQFTAVGTDKDTADSMKALIRQSINNLMDTGVLARETGDVVFAEFACHGKMHPRVSEEELRAGFMTKQVALQGRRSTWYTGAAFSAGFTTVVWEYNNVVLPKLIEGI